MRQTRAKSHENLTKANIAKVISLLEGDKPITKKEACGILNISYNTTRLGNILAEFKEDLERTARIKSKLRGKPAQEHEIQSIVQGYLEGDNVSGIATRIYRSPAFVKSVIERIGVPMKLPESDYEGIRSAMLPEQCVAESFEPNEIVWAIRKNYPAIVKHEVDVEHQFNNKGYAGYQDYSKCVNYEEKYGAKMYVIYTIEETDLSDTFFPWVKVGGRFSTQLAYELGSLRHLKQYGVSTTWQS